MNFIYRTRINQYQAIVEPLMSWLVDRGVNILSGCLVSDVILDEDPSRITAEILIINRDGENHEVPIGAEDLIFITNGSHISDLAIGSMASRPNPKRNADPWKL